MIEKPIGFFHETWEFSNFETFADDGSLLISRCPLLARLALVCNAYQIFEIETKWKMKSIVLILG